MANQNDDLFRETILQRIDEQKCVLVIGPDIASPDPVRSVNDLLKERIAVNVNEEIGYYHDDEFFSFDGPDEKEYAIIQIQNFFKSLQPNDLYRKIAEIPFHLIFSTSPDRLLLKAFDEKRLPYDYDFYDKENNPKSLAEPTSERPLVYNLFGDIQTESSLVYTYDDLFDYLFKIFGDFKLPQTIQTELREASIVLFLGFKFDKWYFKLLLRLLKLNKVRLKGVSVKEKNFGPDVKTFYSDEFKLKFLDCKEEEILDFIHEKCRENNTLRMKQSLATKTKSEIYISYAWGGESERVADRIQSCLAEKGINIVRDKNALGYNGNIKAFMETIGAGKYVIVVLSDKYLKSDNCMFEMFEMKKNGELFTRMFPIVLNDATIYGEKNRMAYTSYWEEQLKVLKESFMETNFEMNEQAYAKIKQYRDIRSIVDEVTDMVRNINTLTVDMLEKTNYAELAAALEEKICQDHPNLLPNGN